AGVAIPRAEHHCCKPAVALSFAASTLSKRESVGVQAASANAGTSNPTTQPPVRVERSRDTRRDEREE
ncbi:MAG: hypothetical protein K2Q27_11005, partial [Novosphingobium sp.]|nr:hypothetical protein [Novosphingobium sp.]